MSIGDNNDWKNKLLTSLKEALKENNLEIPKEYMSLISFDPDDELDYESKNIHYVAISRANEELYFMVFDNQ